ncbi:hypothetical protein RRG08_056515, partial [Elysia crispata]
KKQCASDITFLLVEDLGSGLGLICLWCGWRIPDSHASVDVVSVQGGGDGGFVEQSVGLQSSGEAAGPLTGSASGRKLTPMSVVLWISPCLDTLVGIPSYNVMGWHPISLCLGKAVLCVCYSPSPVYSLVSPLCWLGMGV